MVIFVCRIRKLIEQADEIFKKLSAEKAVGYTIWSNVAAQFLLTVILGRQVNSITVTIISSSRVRLATPRRLRRGRKAAAEFRNREALLQLGRIQKEDF